MLLKASFEGAHRVIGLLESAAPSCFNRSGNCVVRSDWKELRFAFAVRASLSDGTSALPLAKSVEMNNSSVHQGAIVVSRGTREETFGPRKTKPTYMYTGDVLHLGTCATQIALHLNFSSATPSPAFATRFAAGIGTVGAWLHARA